MPLYDSQGNEIAGAMTAEEVQARVGEATTVAKAEAEIARLALETDLTAAKELLDKTTAEMAGMSDKEKNEAKMGQIVRQQEKVIADLNSKIDSVKTEVMGSVTARAREQMIKSLADGDKDLEAKIKVQYERLIKLEAKIDDETISRVAADAYRLSAENIRPSVLNRVISGKPIGSMPRSDSSVSPELMEAAGAFGLTEEDIKTHGGNK